MVTWRYLIPTGKLNFCSLGEPVVICHNRQAEGPRKILPGNSGHLTVQPHWVAWQATDFPRTTLWGSCPTWAATGPGVEVWARLEKLVCPRPLGVYRAPEWLWGRWDVSQAGAPLGIWLLHPPVSCKWLWHQTHSYLLLWCQEELPKSFHSVQFTNKQGPFHSVADNAQRMPPLSFL